MVPAFQTWWLRHKTRTWKTAKKFEDVKLQALLDEDYSQTQKLLVEQLCFNQQTVTDWLREMGWIQKRVSWKANGKSQKHMWHFARSVQKEVVFASHSYRGWKMDLFSKVQAQKSWVDRGAPSTSTARSNRFGRKTMLCVWWDQRAILALLKLWSEIIKEITERGMHDERRSQYSFCFDQGDGRRASLGSGAQQHYGLGFGRCGWWFY